MNFNNSFHQSRLQAYTDHLKSAGLEDSSIRRKLSSLKSFKKFLTKQGYVKKTSTLALHIPKSKNRLFQFAQTQLQSSSYLQYLVAALLLIIFSGLSYGIYYQTRVKVRQELAYSTAASPTSPGRFLSFQGRLTDSSGNPITAETGIIFKLFDVGTTGVGTTLYTSQIGNSQTVDPDDNGIFNVTIGLSHGTTIPSSVFTENPEVWLEITAGGEVMNPRQQIATVAYALNADTLQGLPPSASGYKDTVLIIDGSGNINLGETNPSIISQSGTFGLEGQAVLLKASDGSGGSITINPDATGQIKLITEGTGVTSVGGYIEATNANLATGNLYSGLIRNDNRSYNFIDFSNYNVGLTSISTRFSVGASGNIYTASNIGVSGSVYINSSSDLYLGSVGLGSTLGATAIGFNPAGLNYIAIGSTTVQTAISQLDSAINSVSGTIQWTLDGDSGTPQIIGAGQTAVFIGGTGINTLVSATDSLYINLDLGSTNTWLADQYFNGNVGIGTTSPSSKLSLIGSGNIFSIGDTAGNTLFSVTDTQITNNLPTSFTGTGNVSLANNLYFSNPISSSIITDSSFVIDVGENYNSDNLTLRTYNAGNLIVESSNFWLDGTNVGIGTTAPGAYKLNVNGSVNVGTTLTTDDLNITGTILDNGATGPSGYLLSSTGSGIDWIAASSVGGTYTAGIGISLSGASSTVINVKESENFAWTGTHTWSSLGVFGAGLGVTGNLTVGGTFVSVGSTNTVTNLSSDYLDGHSSDYFLAIGSTGSFITTLTEGTYIDITGTGVGRTIAFDPTEVGNVTWGSGSASTWTFNAGATDPTLYLSSNIFSIGNANVGIGTTAPNQKLAVAGNVDFTGHLALGTDGAISSSAILDLDETLTTVGDNFGLIIEPTFNLTTNNWGQDQFGLYVDAVANNVVDNYNTTIYGAYLKAEATDGSDPQNIFGSYSYALNSGTSNTATISSLIGARNYAINDDTGDANLIRAVDALARNDGQTGNVYAGYFTAQNASTLGNDYANYYGVYSVIDNDVTDIAGVMAGDAFYGKIDIGTSALTQTAHGLYLDLANSGTITTTYGIYLNDIIEGTQTNAYGIWANEGDWVLDEDGNGSIGGTGPGGDLALGEGQDLKLYHDGTNSYITNTTNDLILNSSGDVSLQSASGNVGIGTTAPLYPLHVGSTGTNNVSAYFTGNIMGQKFSDLTDYDKYYLDPANSSTTDSSLSLHRTGSIKFNAYYSSGWKHTLTGASSKIEGMTNGLLIGIGTSTADTPIIGWSDTKVIFLDTSGNVGIGTTAPTSKLHVSGDLNIVNTILTNGSTGPSGYILSSTGTGLSWLNPSGIGNTYTAGIGISLSGNTINVKQDYAFSWSGTHNYSAADLNFTNATSFTLDTTGDLFLDADGGDIVFGDNGSWWGGWKSGNFGIGTTSPSYTLHAVGNNNATNFYFVGNTSLSGEQDLFVIEDNDTGGGSQDHSSSFKVLKSASWNAADQGSSLIEVTYTGADSGEDEYYIAGRKTDEGTPLWGVDLTDNDIWTTGGLKIGVSGNSNGSYSGGLFVVNSDGNVGIGTTAPEAKLHLEGNLMVGGSEFYFEDSTGGGDASLIRTIHFNNNDDLVYNDTLNQYKFSGDGSDYMVIDDGNVGIGTTAPVKNLHLSASKDVTLRLASTYNAQDWTPETDTFGQIEFYSADSGGPGAGVRASIKAINETIYGLKTSLRFSTTNATTNDVEAMRITSDQNIGIGTTAPSRKLDVNGSVGADNVALYVYDNDDAPTCNTTNLGMILSATAGIGATNNVTQFYICRRAINGNDGSIHWYYIDNAYLVSDYPAVDLAEYVYCTDPSVSAGDVVANDPNHQLAIKKATNQKEGLAIISTNPDTVMGRVIDDTGNLPYRYTDEEMENLGYRPVTVGGRIPVKIHLLPNQTINHNDYIAASTLPGFGAKPTTAGRTLGYTLESFNPNTLACPTVSSTNDIVWPDDNGSNQNKPCFQLPDGSYVGKVMVMVENSFHDPDLELTETGQIMANYNIDESVLKDLGYSDTLNELQTAQYELKDQFGQPVERLGQFAEIAASKLKTGLLTATNIITKTIVSETSKTKELQTAVITPLDDITDTITVDGDLDVIGTITADNIEAQTATVGTLYAEDVISKSGSFKDLMTDKIADLRSEVRNLIDTQIPDYPNTPLYELSEGWIDLIASGSAQINGNLTLTDNLIVGAALSVQGQTQLADAFITGTFTTGQIAIRDNFIETTATALYIQPSALGSVHIMGDTLVIADNGSVIVNGDLTVSGRLTANEASASSLFANLITASEAEFESLQVNRDATISGNLAINTLKVATDSAQPIIAESGFAQLATSSAQLESNAAAGIATLPAGKTELVIVNEKVTTSSMVYLTPAGSTGNQVIYIKEKFVSPTPTPESTESATPQSYFTIALDQPLTVDLDINWWIIN